MDSENASFRSSARPQSRIPHPGAPVNTDLCLTELSESQNNARQPTSMLQPPKVSAGLKREIPQPAHESEPKRKTLAERVEEYPQKPVGASKKGPPRAKSHVQGQSLSSQVKMPGNSNYSRHGSVSSVSTNSRNTFNGSFSQSVGRDRYGASERPKTSTANRPPLNRTRTNTTVSRPQIAYGSHSEADDEGTEQNAVDVDGGVVRADDTVKQLKEFLDNQSSSRKLFDETIEVHQKRAAELEDEKNRIDARNQALQDELDTTRDHLTKLTIDGETVRRNHKYELEDEARKHRNEFEELRKEFNEETERLQKSHREALEGLDRHYRVELEDERSFKSKELEELRAKLGNEQQDMHLTLRKKDCEVADARAQLEGLKRDVDREQALKKGLEANISEMAASNVMLEAKINSLKSQVEFLESDSKAQSDSFTNMEDRLQEALRVADEARQKLIKEETERRILFNKYQELKGNIRVMCRVRPVLDDPAESEAANMSFPDEKTSAEIALQGGEETSAMGKVTRKNFNFEFDRVFAPEAANQDVFDEISQLVQSALDGYNVCIFCYGQTGSGKTHTMSSDDGMIPRATHMIYDTMTKLEEKSWTYSMEGSFIEVYNEELHDLLRDGPSSSSSSAAKKLEIRHDEARKQTTVSNCKTVALDSPGRVEAMLAEAQSNRSVAATRSNERSSRSHSVFALRLSGRNGATGERCEGTLNLVDLAGSERLKASGAEGERMRETQSINKSLACLGDVIEALGRGSAHVPYRNSKLTHLLQYSLGGNSKTLMFVMVSPLEAHLKETLTSLRFATKVHNTHIGTAKAIKKA